MTPRDMELIQQAPDGGFFNELRKRAAGDRYYVKDRKDREITITRIFDRKIAIKLLQDAQRYPNGHRNLTKAQRRAWGLMGKPGRLVAGMVTTIPVLPGWSIYGAEASL